MPPSYVKPYVKRRKTDAADAAAICEAVTGPSMRFVAIKSESCSSVLVIHRTQTGNAIRAHMTELGIIAVKGAQNVDRLKEHLDRLPEVARMPVSLLFDQLAETNKRIERLIDEIEETHKQSETSQRLATIPGVGMLSATTPNVDNFGEGLCRLARPHSQTALDGGKQRVGRISQEPATHGLRSGQ